MITVSKSIGCLVALIIITQCVNTQSYIISNNYPNQITSRIYTREQDEISKFMMQNFQERIKKIPQDYVNFFFEQLDILEKEIETITKKSDEISEYFSRSKNSINSFHRRY
jgi:hypothetical protein